MKLFTGFFLLIFCLVIFRPKVYSQNLDVEVDPVAYLLDGYSFHVGLNTASVRYSVGLFSLGVPESFHGNSDFEHSFSGGGVKVNYFFRNTNYGFYTGIGTDMIFSTFELKETGNTEEKTQFNISANIGYRLRITKQLYINPWLGISYWLNTSDFEIENKVFEQSPLGLFPTVHVGWRF
jgi:hypothetical protein